MESTNPSISDIKRKVEDSISYIRPYLEYPDNDSLIQGGKYLLALFEYLMSVENVTRAYPLAMIKHLENCFNSLNEAIDVEKEDGTEKIIFNQHADVYYKNQKHKEALRHLIMFKLATA
jgi:hypothetical protein